MRHELWNCEDGNTGVGQLILHDSVGKLLLTVLQEADAEAGKYTYAAAGVFVDAKAEAELLDALQKRAGTCKWTYDEEGEFYETHCKQAFQFNDGTPTDNSVRFCHGCGKPIEVIEKGGV